MVNNSNMNTPNSTSNLTKKNTEESFVDLGTILKILILNWHWFVLSVCVCMAVAFVYLRYADQVYQVSAKVLIKDESKKRSYGGQTIANMQDFGFMSNSMGIDNEMEILQSLVLAREAVKDLKLYTSYKVDGTIKDRLIYRVQPINVDIDSASLNRMDDFNSMQRVTRVNLLITREGDKYNVKGTAFTTSGDEREKPFEASFASLPNTIETPAGSLTFTANNGIAFPTGKSLIVDILPPTIVAARHRAGMSVKPVSETTTIALLTVNDQSAARGEDFLKQLIICYNRQANADKNEIAVKTEEFINGRLEKINAELGTTEGELEDYKKRNKLTHIRLDASETLAQASQYSVKLNEAKSQIQLLDYLREYIDDPKNKYQIIPSNVGLQDVGSTALISRFNQNVLDRNRMLHSASERAPQVIALTSMLDDLQGSIREALAQARQSAEITKNNIQQQYTQYQTRIAKTPEQERILTQIGRQQEVKSGLYMMLLQKREENSISLAATADKGKMIDDPMFGGKVSPKTNAILLIALVLGLGLPLVVIYILSLLRYKIEGHDDVAKLTDTAIVADVPVVNEEIKSKAGIVVQENQNNHIDEIYRSLRTNIQFMLHEDQKVIMFTSFLSGEGKTFNAANLAMSFALLGKRVILLGLDIRRPALGVLFGISDKASGITPLLAKTHVSDSDLLAQIQPSGINNNLDLLFAGPIPPNPTELLAKENLGEIINLLKTHYDYIILDTAPVGLVSDTLQIARLADVSAIVCRADHTPRSAFDYLNTLVYENKLPNACVILNGVDMTKKKYGYYYGYGRYGKYGRYGGYGRHGSYRQYGTYGTYSAYNNSHYGNKNDNSIKK